MERQGGVSNRYLQTDLTRPLSGGALLLVGASGVDKSWQGSIVYRPDSVP